MKNKKNDPKLLKIADVVSRLVAIFARIYEVLDDLDIF